MLASVRVLSGRAAPARSASGSAPSKHASVPSRTVAPKKMLQSAGFATQAAKSSGTVSRSILGSSRLSVVASEHVRSGSLEKSMSSSRSQHARLMNVNLGAKENIYESGRTRRSSTLSHYFL